MLEDFHYQQKLLLQHQLYNFSTVKTNFNHKLKFVLRMLVLIQVLVLLQEKLVQLYLLILALNGHLLVIVNEELDLVFQVKQMPSWGKKQK